MGRHFNATPAGRHNDDTLQRAIDYKQLVDNADDNVNLLPPL